MTDPNRLRLPCPSFPSLWRWEETVWRMQCVWGTWLCWNPNLGMTSRGGLDPFWRNLVERDLQHACACNTHAALGTGELTTGRDNDKNLYDRLCGANLSNVYNASNSMVC